MSSGYGLTGGTHSFHFHLSASSLHPSTHPSSILHPVPYPAAQVQSQHHTHCRPAHHAHYHPIPQSTPTRERQLLTARPSDRSRSLLSLLAGDAGLLRRQHRRRRHIRQEEVRPSARGLLRVSPPSQRGMNYPSISVHPSIHHPCVHPSRQSTRHSMLDTK